MSRAHPIQFIDTLKGFLILGVILIHTSLTGEIVRILLLFSITPFFFINGILISNYFDKKGIEFLKKMSRSILIPYFLIGLLSYFYWIIVNSIFDLGSSTPILKPLVGLFYGNGHEGWLIMNTPLWFLPCLFSVQGLHYLSRKIPSKPAQWSMVLILFVLGVLNSFHPLFAFRLPFGLEMAFYLLLLNYMGTEWKNYWIQSGSGHIHGWFLFTISLIGSYVLTHFMGVMELSGNVLVSNEQLSFAGIIFSVPLALLALPILFFLTFKNLHLPKALTQPLVFIGRYSLYYFTLHIPVFGISEFIQRFTNSRLNSVFLDFSISLIVISLGIYGVTQYKSILTQKKSVKSSLSAPQISVPESDSLTP